MDLMNTPVDHAGRPDNLLGNLPNELRRMSGGYLGNLFRPDGRFQSVSVHDAHVCALRLDGTAECWGSSMESGGGAAGDVSPPPGTFLSIATARYYNCGLRPSGAVDCWGDPAKNEGSVDVEATQDSTFTSLSLGSMGGCGVLEKKTYYVGVPGLGTGLIRA